MAARRAAAGSRNMASPQDGSSTRSDGERIAQSTRNRLISNGVKKAPRALRALAEKVIELTTRFWSA